MARLIAERGLVAELSRLQFRDQRLGSLRWAAAVSFPIWLQAHASVVPAPVVFLASLAQGLLLALAVSYGALEALWERRARRFAPTVATIRGLWTTADELRSAFWQATALASAVPWAYGCLDRRLPASLLSPLTAAAVSLFLLAAIADTAAQRRTVPGRSTGPSSPPLRSVRHGGLP